MARETVQRTTPLGLDLTGHLLVAAGVDRMFTAKLEGVCASGYTEGMRFVCALPEGEAQQAGSPRVRPLLDLLGDGSPYTCGMQ